ncbi:hypothetical protein BGZ98_001991 [Dissophora globulifera]|nr:hypothetical protein BGZ98_001991 [Dissophora globulifera]
MAVLVNNTNTLNYRTYDPMTGESNSYTLPGLLVMGNVQTDCTVQVNPAAGPAGRAIMDAIDPTLPRISATILVLRYDWLDHCATYDDVFAKLDTLNTQLQSLTLPPVGAVVMDGNAQSNEDFGAPFTQIADAKHWNQVVRLNISFMGSDDVASVGSLLAANNQALLATVAQEQGPWNKMWRSVGFNVVIRGLDILSGLDLLYGIWVLLLIRKTEQEGQHYRRYVIVIPGCIYLPLSIAFAPYKVTVVWRNAMYYFSLLFPFISLGLQILMWSSLIYRIKRMEANRIFAAFAYFSIFVPVASAFLNGIGWLVPSLPIIRMIGERGFSWATPAVILIQAILVFYYAITFFKYLRSVAVSQKTRTALIKITVLNLAMISFFILMFLSQVVSVLGLNNRSVAAYITQLVIFRFSFVFFYACCFRTLSIRQPGSTDEPNSASNGNRTPKNHTHYHMDSFGNTNSKGNNGGGQDSQDDKPKHFNKHLSNHASTGFTIPDPSNVGGHKAPAFGGPIQITKQSPGFTSQQQLINPDERAYSDPYKSNEFGHFTREDDIPIPRGEHGMKMNGYVDSEYDENRDSVYGNHRFQNSPTTNHPHAGNGGMVVGGRARNSDGYSRFDMPDESHGARAI